jgi:hypothetical protein
MGNKLCITDEAFEILTSLDIPVVNEIETLIERVNTIYHGRVEDNMSIADFKYKLIRIAKEDITKSDALLELEKNSHLLKWQQVDEKTRF